MTKGEMILEMAVGATILLGFALAAYEALFVQRRLKRAYQEGYKEGAHGYVCGGDPGMPGSGIEIIYRRRPPDNSKPCT